MDESGPDQLFRALESNVANPILRVLLRSPLHFLASKYVMLVDYRGRKSGTRYVTPVAFVRDDGEVVAMTFREAATWWRNFRDDHPTTVWLQGQPVEATGRAILDEGEIADEVAFIADRAGWLLDFFDVDASASREEFENTAQGLVVVRFSLS